MVIKIKYMASRASPGFWFGRPNIGQNFIREFNSSPVLYNHTMYSPVASQNFGSGRDIKQTLLNGDFWKILKNLRYIKCAQKFKNFSKIFKGQNLRELKKFSIVLWKCRTFWKNKKCNCVLKKIIKVWNLFKNYKISKKY